MWNYRAVFSKSHYVTPVVIAITHVHCNVSTPLFAEGAPAVGKRVWRGMETLNRSDRSDMFQDRELMEAVLQKTDDPGRLNDSGGSRLSSLFIPQQSLRSTGNLSRPPSIVSNSKRSVAFSQEKISDVSDPLVEKEDSLRLEYLKINIIGLVMLSVCSLILALVSLQLTLYLGPKETTPASSVVDNNQTFMTLVEVATALSTFVVTLDITCLLVCSMQCLVVIKLLSVDQGEDR